MLTKTVLRGAVVVVTSLYLGACGGEEDAPSIHEVDFASGSAEAGASVYSTRCAGCHGADGKGTGAGPDIAHEVHELAEDEIAGVIKNGYEDMPAQSLDDQQIADVVAWLQTTFGP